MAANLCEKRSISPSRENIIFPKGIRYYTYTSQDLVLPRYDELMARVASSLPEDDPLRQHLLDAIIAGLEAYSAAVVQLTTARSEASIARTHLADVREEWRHQMVLVYATLLGKLGKPAAERFFPRSRPRKSSPKSQGDGKTGNIQIAS